MKQGAVEPNGHDRRALTAFQKRLATTAQQQFERYRLLRENQQPLAGQIRLYWQQLGFRFPGVQVPWSAVFVSWCVKRAGATASRFQFAAAHARFVHAAIANTKRGQGVFLGRDPASYAPKIGDILQNNRGKHKFDFKYAATHKSYESHSAIVTEVGADNRGRYLRTIGGNEGDSVGLREVRLTDSGLVDNPDRVYIALIETRL